MVGPRRLGAEFFNGIDPEQKFGAVQSRRLMSEQIRGNRFSARSPHDDRRPVERELGVRSEYLSA